jgi:hypothetical protein
MELQYWMENLTVVEDNDPCIDDDSYQEDELPPLESTNGEILD